MNIEQCQLTNEEIDTVVRATHNSLDDQSADRPIANAATEKALRSVLLWLQEFEDTHSDRREQIVAIWRGDGLEMAADELEAMLAAGHS